MSAYDQPEWTLAQLIAWVCLRTVHAVNTPDGIPMLSKIEASPKEELKVEIDDAMLCIRQHLNSERLIFSGFLHGKFKKLPTTGWMSRMLLFNANKVREDPTGRIWTEITISREQTLKLWPPLSGNGRGQSATLTVPESAKRGPRSNQNSPKSEWCEEVERQFEDGRATTRTSVASLAKGILAGGNYAYEPDTIAKAIRATVHACKTKLKVTPKHPAPNGLRRSCR